MKAPYIIRVLSSVEEFLIFSVELDGLMMSYIQDVVLGMSSDGAYAHGDVHINTCEGEFSVLRTFMRIHRGVAKYNMPFFKKRLGDFRKYRRTRSR